MGTTKPALKYTIIHVRWLDNRALKIERTVVEKQRADEHLSIALEKAGIDQDSIQFAFEGDLTQLPTAAWKIP